VRVKLAPAAIAIAGDILVRGVSTRKNQTKADAPIFSPVKQRGKYLEYLIVFTVAAMMIGYVWMIARCLRNA
jgi:hypothetical protein